MNIGIFTDTYQPDINGVATSIATVEKGLRVRGERVFVVAPNNRFRYAPTPLENTWRLASIPFYGEGRYRFVLPISFHRKEISPLPFDIIHTQTPFPVGSLGHTIAKCRKIPLVHTYHTRYQEYSHYLHMPQRIARIVAQTAMWQIMRFVNDHDAVIAPSSSIKSELESFGVKKPISIIPTGIDIEEAKRLALAKDPNDLLGKLGIAANEDYMIFTSRLGKEKNIGFILSVMQAIVKERSGAKLIIVGDGDVRQALEMTVAKMGLQKNIVFAGFLSHGELFPLYRNARAFLFSSLTETQGLVILEAMSLGVPVIALRATGVEDALLNNKGGFLVDGTSLDVFVAQTLAVLGNQALHDEKSMEAIAHAQEFSIDVTTTKLLELYNYASAIAARSK